VTPFALPEPGPDEATIGALIRDARQARRWSQKDWANRYVKLRAAAGEVIDPFSAKTQLSAWEHGRRVPDDRSQFWIAQTFDTSPEALFGLSFEHPLPRPLILSTHVTPDTIERLKRQRAIHAETEHALGPRVAADLVSVDLRTIADLVRVTPAYLSPEVHACAASVAELAGWIAQECGYIQRAKMLTVQARDYAEGTTNLALQAMILMRSANIAGPSDPLSARLLADRAASLAASLPPSRLHATIARQQAHLAALLGDRPGFDTFSAQAAEYAQADLLDDDLAPYAHPGYVVSETAVGLIVLNEAGSAADLLADGGLELVPGQERDHGVAQARWLQALVACGDYATAAEHWRRVAIAYLRAPSQRAKVALRAVIEQRDTADPIHLRDLQRDLRHVVSEGRPPS
jgi:transcriptional regulator with XRE-family HTH domain